MRTLISILVWVSIFGTTRTLADEADVREAFFGDLHVHTRYSFDAYIFNIRADPDDGSLTLLVDDMERPNGLAFSPDESKLYVADSTRYLIKVFDVNEDGTLSNGQVFVELPAGEGETGVPDGMKIDVEGNLYSTGPKYRSSQARVSLINSFLGGIWSVAYNFSSLCSSGVPKRSNIVLAISGG